VGEYKILVGEYKILVGEYKILVGEYKIRPYVWYTLPCAVFRARIRPFRPISICVPMTLPEMTTLNGSWRLLPVETFAQGYYPLDDDAWIVQDLPAHWQQHPLLERYSGKVVYRKRFTLDVLDDRPSLVDQRELPVAYNPVAPMRYWLRLNGAFYWSHTYFNGVDLGRHEGYFFAQEYEVSDWVAAENTIIVELDCPDEHDKFGKRLITGVFSHWDCLDPETNPGGIWLPVELIRTGSVRAQEIQLQSEHVSDAAAELRFRATLDSADSRDVVLRWIVAPHNFAGAIQTIEQRRSLASGSQVIGGSIEIRDPQLWWTHDMGHPNLYRVTLEVLCDGQVSDSHSFNYGIRTFRMQNWIAYLNDVRVFIKGNNYGPGDTRIATMTREAFDRDMRLAQQCHMNMLRVHAHVEHPAFYAAADEAGILLWQDFPLHWLYRREILPEARRQATQMVRLLFNHPSVALWCMHNEPLYTADTKDERMLTRIRTYASVFIYSWNRDVMDTQLKQLVEAEDQTRPVVRSSGEYAVPFLRPGTDGHYYYGWYIVYGRLHSWPIIARQFPDNIRFVTEFGAQSFPNIESSVKFMDADIAKIDWQHLTERHHFQPDVLAHWIDWQAAGSLEELVQITQDYQIHVNRFYIDRLRLAKYRPTGGIVPFMFHDSNPAVQWSILDYWRVPKRSYTAMQLAFSPQYLFTVIDGERFPVAVPREIPIYVVNDAHQSVSVTVLAILTAPDGRELARIERSLDLPADCMTVELERLRLTPTMVGTYTLKLELRPEDGENQVQQYEMIIVPAR